MVWFWTSILLISSGALRPSSWIGIPYGAPAILLDLTLLMFLPLGLMFRIYNRRHSARQRSARQAFLQQWHDAELLVFRYNPQQIFRVTAEDPAQNLFEVQTVWRAGAAITDAQAYPSKRQDFVSFDPDRFLEQGL